MVETLQTSNILATLANKTQNLESQDMGGEIPLFAPEVNDLVEFKDSAVTILSSKGLVFVFGISLADSADLVK